MKKRGIFTDASLFEFPEAGDGGATNKKPLQHEVEAVFNNPEHVCQKALETP